MNSKIKELKELLETDVLIELEENIEELEEENAKENKEELQYLQNLKIYFYETLKAIDENNLSIQQAEDILTALENMKNEEI